MSKLAAPFDNERKQYFKDKKAGEDLMEEMVIRSVEEAVAETVEEEAEEAVEKAGKETVTEAVEETIEEAIEDIEDKSPGQVVEVCSIDFGRLETSAWGSE